VKESQIRTPSGPIISHTRFGVDPGVRHKELAQWPDSKLQYDAQAAIRQIL